MTSLKVIGCNKKGETVEYGNEKGTFFHILKIWHNGSHEIFICGFNYTKNYSFLKALVVILVRNNESEQCSVFNSRYDSMQFN